jgi:hypothetical protein
MIVLNCAKNLLLKPQGQTQQNAHGIKLKMTVTGGAEWPRSWPRRLGGDGGGDSDQKRSETAPVLNGVCGGGKQGFSNRAQMERF